MKKFNIITLIMLLLSINISAQVTDLRGPYGMVFNGNDLYIAEYGANKISKIDISETNPTKTNVITGITNPLGALINENDLYFTQRFPGRISKFELPVLSVENISQIDLFKIYPNPATAIISIQNNSNFELEGIRIYDINGRLVAHHIAEDNNSNQTINVSDLASGIYMLHIYNNQAITIKRLIKN
jgi:DNA-binding beta-propeller fold protein YncE